MNLIARFSRSAVKALVVPFVGLVLAIAPGRAAEPVAPSPAAATAYLPLTTQSVPQMLQATGYQVQAKTDSMGTYWIAQNAQGKTAMIEPKLQGGVIKGLKISHFVNMPGSAIPTAQQLNNLRAQLAPTHGVNYLPATSQLPAALSVFTEANYPDSNPQELRGWIEGTIAKGTTAQQFMNNIMNSGNQVAPVPAPAPAPAPVPAPGAVINLTNTTWTGSEQLPAPYGSLKFEFKPGNLVIMTDGQGPHQGTYSVNGNQITVSLPGVGSYQGTVNGNTFSGHGNDATFGNWNFSVTKQ